MEKDVTEKTSQIWYHIETLVFADTNNLRLTVYLCIAFTFSESCHLTFLMQYQSTRPFYIQVEMAEDSYKGEQLGVRIALFNYWNTALEVMFCNPHV